MCVCVCVCARPRVAIFVEAVAKGVWLLEAIANLLSSFPMACGKATYERCYEDSQEKAERMEDEADNLMDQADDAVEDLANQARRA